jgi:hypothetical protein
MTSCIADMQYSSKTARAIRLLGNAPKVVRFFTKPFMVNSDRLAFSQIRRLVALAREYKVKVEFVHLGSSRKC